MFRLSFLYSLEEAINISGGRFTNHAVWLENKNLGFHKFLRFRFPAPYLILRPVSYSTPVRLDPNTSYFFALWTIQNTIHHFLKILEIKIHISGHRQKIKSKVKVWSKMMKKKRESMSAPPIASWQEPRHCDDTLMTPMLSLSTQNGTKYGWK